MNWLEIETLYSRLITSIIFLDALVYPYGSRQLDLNNRMERLNVKSPHLKRYFVMASTIAKIIGQKCSNTHSSRWTKRRIRLWTTDLLYTFYERGFNPLTPIDLIASLPMRGMKDKCPKDVTARLEYLENMRSVVQDKLQHALTSYEHYYNAQRRDETRIKVGSLVRLKLDHIKLQIFRNRPTSKLNPLWYGPFRVIAQPTTDG